MNKEINLKKFLIVLSILVLIEIILLWIFNKDNNDEASEHCKLAVCNESKTICYNYDLDSDGKTIVTWKGSCAQK